MKKLIILLAFLAGCATSQIPDIIPVPQPGTVCVGDLDKDGVVSLDEVQAVAIFKMSSPTDAVSKYSLSEVLAVVDENDNATIDDAEFFKVISNQTKGYCVYLFGVVEA